MNPLIITTGLLGFAAVALGAFGAHGLAGRLPDAAQGWWQTATLYALAHIAPALAIALIAGDGSSPWLTRAGWAFMLGVLLFSGSLYAMALTTLFGEAWRALGPVTPLGGVCFLAGWAMVMIAGLTRA